MTTDQVTELQALQSGAQARPSVAERAHTRPGIALAIGIVAIAILYTALVVAYLRPRNAVKNLDFWPHIDVGYAQDWSRPESLVNGLYPMGYPLLLRSAIGAGLDVLRFGQFLSWLGGLLCLIALAGITYSVTRSRVLACLAALLPLANLYFLQYAVYEGNDMLSAGLQMLALMVLWPIDSRQPSRRAWALAAAGGALLGLAYLSRYTALLLLPCALLYVLWKSAPLPWRSLAGAAILLGAFALVSAPQTIPATLAYHDPFFNLQAKNVWFGLYGGWDWVNGWPKVPDTITLPQVIAIDPSFFFTHWWKQFSSLFVSMRVWNPVVHVVWLVAALVFVFDRRLHPANRMLAVLALLVPVAATAMAWLHPRFLLIALALQILMVVLAAHRLASLVRVHDAWRAAALALLLVAAALPLEWPGLAAWAAEPVMALPDQVNSFLRAAGMQSAGEVVTNDESLHLADSPARTRYVQGYFIISKPTGVDQLLADPHSAQWRFLAVNYDGGLGDYGGLRESAEAPDSRVLRLSGQDFPVAIYCVKPCSMPDAVQDGLLFDGGVRLVAHLWKARDGVSGVYFYWQVDQAVQASYKVSVRLMDGAGGTLYQDDSIPQLWQRPTNTWAAREVVPDFHLVPANPACPQNCRLGVVLYDEATGKPALARTPSGEQLGPIVVLP